MARLGRLLGLPEGPVDPQAARPVDTLGLGQVVAEPGILGQDRPPRHPLAIPGDRGRLVDGPPHHADRPPGVAHLGEGEDAQVVDGAAAMTGEVRHRERAVLRNDAVDAVVVRRGRAQAEHVPVAPQFGFGPRHDREDVVGVALGRLGDRAAARPRRVLEAGAEGVVAGDVVPAVGGDGDPVGRELSRHERHAVGEERVGEGIGAVGPEVAHGGARRHHDPPDGAVGPGDLGEDVEAVDERQLGTAHVARHDGRVQPRLLTQPDGLVGHRCAGALGLRPLGVEL